MRSGAGRMHAADVRVSPSIARSYLVSLGSQQAAAPAAPVLPPLDLSSATTALSLQHMVTEADLANDEDMKVR